jgi:hypothetical protein
MCQGTCSTASCQKTCSPAEKQLRHALAEIQTIAQQQLQALVALRGPDGQLPPAAFALQLISTRAAAVIEAAPAPVLAEAPVTMHGSLKNAFTATCGCRSTADCRCVTMDLAAAMLYKKHEQHRQPAAA